MKDTFRKFSNSVSQAMGSPRTFLLAVLIVLAWAVTGPMFDYSDTWQLVINTGTTIVTFLMVFVIQNSQNRDAMALHLKLDELLRAVEGARTSLVNIEGMQDEKILELRDEFRALGKKHDETCEP